MTANTGRTHNKHVQVYLDNSGGTLTDITAYINSVGQFGLTYDTADVTAWSDGAKNIVLGHPDAPITLSGPLDTTIVSHMTAINGVNTPLSFDIRIGIRHAWESGEPQFGITSSSSVGYLVDSFNVDLSSLTWTATLKVFGATAPAFGTSAET